MNASEVRGVVVVVVRDGRCLLIRRAAWVGVPGAGCFVGGAIEAGEAEADAVVREFREELGGAVRPLRRIWEYARPDGTLRLYWWLADLASDELRANPTEVAEWRWCRRDEIEALPNVLESNRAFLAAIGPELLGPPPGR